MSRTIIARDRPVETVTVPDQRQLTAARRYVGGIIPDELVAELDALRRGAGMTLDQVADKIGISRPQLSNARMGRFGLSIAAADRLMGWLSHPPPIRQPALL